MNKPPTAAERKANAYSPYMGGTMRNDPSWVRVTSYDSARRRAVWMRCSEGCVELRCGREGDDGYISLSDGQTIDISDLADIVDFFRQASGAIAADDDPDVTDDAFDIGDNKPRWISSARPLSLFQRVRMWWNLHR